MVDDSEVSKNIQSDQTSDSPTSVKYAGSQIKIFSKIKFPKFRSFRLGKSHSDTSPDISTKKSSLLWLWLLLILGSYTCMGYFFSVLLTIPNQRNLAIAGFVIVGMLPTITAFADFALIKWGYLISGFLIVGGLIFLTGVKFHLAALAIIAWLGITLIAFVGDYLVSKNRKSVEAIAMITAPCLVGLGIGWQIWKLAATSVS